MLKPNAIYFAQAKKALHLSNNVTTINYNKKGGCRIKGATYATKEKRGTIKSPRCLCQWCVCVGVDVGKQRPMSSKKCNVCKNSSFSLNERRKFRFWS